MCRVWILCLVCGYAGARVLVDHVPASSEIGNQKSPGSTRHVAVVCRPHGRQLHLAPTPCSRPHTHHTPTQKSRNKMPPEPAASNEWQGPPAGSRRAPKPQNPQTPVPQGDAAERIQPAPGEGRISQLVEAGRPHSTGGPHAPWGACMHDRGHARHIVPNMRESGFRGSRSNTRHVHARVATPCARCARHLRILEVSNMT